MMVAGPRRRLTGNEKPRICARKKTKTAYWCKANKREESDVQCIGNGPLQQPPRSVTGRITALWYGSNPF